MQHTDNIDYLKKIIKIQSIIKSQFIRDQYIITPLANNQLTHYPTFVVGNDPKMPIKLKNYAEPNEKIALIATSGMRAISIACQLGNADQLPKIFLVDNSLQVTTFWKILQQWVLDDSTAGNEALFFQNLKKFLNNYSYLYWDIPDLSLKMKNNNNVKYLSQNIKKFFIKLISQYNYDFMRRVISHTTIIKQSWEDPETFRKIKNIISYLGINKVFMYPSNIVPCVGNEEIENQILKNIESLSPVLSIHTNFCAKHGEPETVLLFTNQSPQSVKSTLFQQPCLGENDNDTDSKKNSFSIVK